MTAHKTWQWLLWVVLSLGISGVHAEPLRVLVWSGSQAALPRAGEAKEAELQFLQLFSEEYKKEYQLVPVAEYEALIPKLLAGEGDVIAANMTITHKRKEQVRFTQAFQTTHEYLIHGKDTQRLKSGKDLNGRQLWVPKYASFYRTAQGLQNVYPKLSINFIDETLDSESIYDRLASGEYDLAIQDGNVLKSDMRYRDDIKKSLQASGQRRIAWAVAPKSRELLSQLNRFLIAHNLTKKSNLVSKSRWQEIQHRGYIRFVMRNNLASYYIWRGELLGFNYELAKQFAKEHKLRYEILVAPDNAAMLDYVLEDEADIALGFLTPTQDRKDQGLRFSRPYHYASELLIGQANADDIDSLDDLGAQTLFLRPSSSYWQSAESLKEQNPLLVLMPAPEDLETENILDSIARGKYNLTIADNHIVDLELTFREDIKSFMALGDPKPQSWALKQGQKDFLGKVNQFIRKHYRGTFYNVNYNKYFRNPRRLEEHYNAHSELKISGQLSPYDDLIKPLAKQYDFDWRLLVAQMHQESRFNPKARSYAGAQGLFQVLPRTAAELGIDQLHKPEQGIEAGIRYMDWVRERMQVHQLPEDQLIWFSLACYNAGVGHVRDAMRLARKKGWRDDIWFGHVERAMLLLSQRHYAAQARYGYVRGNEPVDYIRAIRRRMHSYTNMIEQ